MVMNINTSIVGDGSTDAVDLATNASAYVGPNGSVSNTNAATAIDGAGANHIVVAGAVLADALAIDLSGGSNSLVLNSSGVVVGDVNLGDGSGSGAAFSNAGTIDGVISLADAGGAVSSVFVNHGTINGSVHDASSGSDNFDNSGAILGNVTFGSGNDFYDGHDGFVGGSVDGGAGMDTLIGGDRADRFNGGSDVDELYGNAGNDVLDGGTGGDLLHGGDGIDSASYRSGGAVFANLLDASTNTGDAAGDVYDSIEGLIGSSQNDRLYGDSQGNRLDGGAGADTMAGQQGNDIYFVDNAGDRVIDSVTKGGDDTIYSTVSFSLANTHVETLVLRGSANLSATGGAFDETLRGNSGDNLIDGGLGSDTLWGGTGSDTFRFDSTLSDKFNVDKVLDFGAPDVIELDQTVFAALTSIGTLAGDQFHLGATAADANDHILYDGGSGKLYYDADGSGSQAAVLFATLTPGTALDASHVHVIG